MKGIVLAGGKGTRLYPLTMGISKQLIPVWGLPMVYYPISVLMRAGIRDILIISTPTDLPNYKALLGEGTPFGVHFEYKEQVEANGLAEAFTIGADFVGSDAVCLILGDNIFIGKELDSLLAESVENAEEKNLATVYGYKVESPERYGIAEIDMEGNCIGIEEKPQNPLSDIAVVGLYFYPNSVMGVAKDVEKSERGEYEITTVNNHYLNRGELKLQCLGDEYTWFDSGTFDDLTKTIDFVKDNGGLSTASLELVAYSKGWISKKDLLNRAACFRGNYYGQFLSDIVK